jgi:hypothetical protein
MSFYKKVEQHAEKKNKNIDLNKNYKFKFHKDKSENHIVELYDGEKLVLKGEFQLIGMYNLINSIWYWGWSIDFVNKQLTEKVQTVKQFPNKIKQNFNKFDTVEADELYFLTSNGSFYTNSKRVDFLGKLAMYLMDGEMVISLCNGRDGTTCSIDRGKKEALSRIEYILITKIL